MRTSLCFCALLALACPCLVAGQTKRNTDELKVVRALHAHLFDLVVKGQPLDSTVSPALRWKVERVRAYAVDLTYQNGTARGAKAGAGAEARGEKAEGRMPAAVMQLRTGKTTLKDALSITDYALRRIDPSPVLFSVSSTPDKCDLKYGSPGSIMLDAGNTPVQISLPPGGYFLSCSCQGQQITKAVELMSRRELTLSCPKARK